MKNKSQYKYVIHDSTSFIYTVWKIEQNFVLEKCKGKPIVYLNREGDMKPLTLTMKMFKAKYHDCEDTEIQEILKFKKEEKNKKGLPLKMEKGRVKFGSEKSKYIYKRKQPVNFLGSIIEPKKSLKDIVFNEDTLNALKLTTARIKNRDKLKKLGVEKIDKKALIPVLNFYGPPGTGKTISAEAIAMELNKNLKIVDYAQMESKWVGETGKNISDLFSEARKNKTLLLFDEADSLVSKRSSGGEGDSTQSFFNMNRNIFMQELDRHTEPVIFTTNLFDNYDEAINRRISQHISFDLPQEEVRVEIFKAHIPEEVPHSLNYRELAKASEGLSGGDIKNVCLNSILEMVSLDVETLETPLVLKNIENIKKTKKVNKNKKIGIIQS